MTGSQHDESESGRRIRAGAVMGYVGFFLSVVAGLLYTPWMVRQVGSSDYGLYVLGLSLISIFLNDFGLGEAAARFISKARVEGEDASLLLGVFLRLYAILDGVIFVVLIGMFLVLGHIFPGLSDEELIRFKVVYVIVGSVGLLSFPFASLSGVLVAFERFAEMRAIDLAQRIVSMGLIILALLSGLGLYALIFANAASGLVVVVVKVLVVRRLVPLGGVLRARLRGSVVSVLRFSLWSGLTVMAQLMVFNAAPALLGVVSNSWEIAQFGLSSSLEGYVYAMAGALNGLFLPRVTRILNREGIQSERGMLELLTKVGRIQLLIIGFVLVGFACLGDDFVRLWLGERYAMVHICALLLIAPSVFYLPQQIANEAVIASNRVKLRGLVFAAMGLVSVLLVSLLGSFWGAIGASIGILAAYSVRNAGMHFVYAWSMRLDLGAFYRDSYVALLPSLAGMLAVGLTLDAAFSGVSISLFLGKAGVLVLMMCAIAWKWGLNHEERSLVRSLLGRG